MKPKRLTFRVGNKVEYLGEQWTITHMENPPFVMHRSFLVLERINPMGSHETTEVDHQAWSLVKEL